MSTYTKRPGFQRELVSTTDPLVLYTQDAVSSTYGDTVSVAAKGKVLNKFGLNSSVGTSFETVAEFQGSTSNETFVSTNIIDSIVSSSTSDTSQTIVVEGHTIDVNGNLTFVIQEASLNGRTEVTLSTPLARANRAYVKASGTFNSTPSDLVGTVSIYDNTDGIANGVPNTDTATKLLISPGENGTQKASTSISKDDYWFVSSFGAGIGVSGGNASRVILRLETRDVPNGGAWRSLTREIALGINSPSVSILIDPYLIVPKSHDFRVRAKTDSDTAEVYAEVAGYLASIT